MAKKTATGKAAIKPVVIRFIGIECDKVWFDKADKKLREEAKGGS